MSPQQKKQRRITIFIILAIVALAAGAYFLLSPQEESYALRSYDSAIVVSGSLEKTTQASGAISIPSQMEIRSPELGYASAVYVIEGDYVEAGEVIAKIDVPDLEESLSDLLDEYETSLLNQEKTRIQNEISIAKSERDIAAKEADVADATEDVQRLERLVAVNSAKQSDLDSAIDQLNNLQDQLNEATIGLNDDLKILAVEEKIQNASNERSAREIERLEEQIASAEITSPMSGEILEIESAIGVPGTKITANQSLFVVADAGSAVADLELLEQYAANVAIGDSVVLTVSNTKFTGVIEQVGRVAQTSSDGLGATVAVRVKPVEAPIALLSGATAVGTFTLGVADDILMLPRGPYLTTGSQRYVYVIDGTTAGRQEVTFGQIEGDTIEVIKGLSAGDEIITSGYQNFIEYQAVKLTQGE